MAWPSIRANQGKIDIETAKHGMEFGKLPVDEAEDALLAHGLSVGVERWSKGRRLSATDIAAARQAGLSSLVVARPCAHDITEDDAAARVAEELCGSGLETRAPVHGRVNLHATEDGLLIIDSPALIALNLIDEDIATATLPDFSPVRRGDLVATIKVIPYALDKGEVERICDAAKAAPLRLARFQPMAVELIHTLLPTISEKLVRKTGDVLSARLAALGSRIAHETCCMHDEAVLADIIAKGDAPITLVSAASATVDRRDVVPAAIALAGGIVQRVGMPVDPGNLLCIGRIGTRIVIGLPGCARSPRRNGIDLVLERLLCGLEVDSAAIAAMGIGGLLQDTVERPEPRETARSAQSGRIAPIVLAAGRASRMGRNKLVTPLNGKPVIAHVVDAIAAAGLPTPLIVLGHDADSVRAALGSRPAKFCLAADHTQGISRTIRAGITEVQADDNALAALVCLGDMPLISPDLLCQIASLAGEYAIVQPRVDGRPGNPVLWGRHYYARLRQLEGDVGAKGLLGEFSDQIRYIDSEDRGACIDIDTPAELAALINESLC